MIWLARGQILSSADPASLVPVPFMQLKVFNTLRRCIVADTPPSSPVHEFSSEAHRHSGGCAHGKYTPLAPVLQPSGSLMSRTE